MRANNAKLAQELFINEQKYLREKQKLKQFSQNATMEEMAQEHYILSSSPMRERTHSFKTSTTPVAYSPVSPSPLSSMLAKSPEMISPLQQMMKTPNVSIPQGTSTKQRRLSQAESPRLKY